MLHFRRKHKQHKNGLDFGIQSQPFNESVTLEPSVETIQPAPTKSTYLPSNTSTSLVKRQKVENLVENLVRVEDELKLLKSKLQQKPREPRRAHLNMMKLQDKQFHIDKNIYNIAVGQIFSKEEYLQRLNNKINQFKGRIRQLQEEEQLYMNKTIQPGEVANRSKTIEGRRSNCGKFYSRLNTPSSERRYFKIGNKESERSSYYKWRPDVEEQPSNVNQNSRARYSIDMTMTPVDRNSQAKEKQYRVKQQSGRPPIVPKTARSAASARTQIKKCGQRVNTNIEALETPKTQKEEFNPEHNEQETKEDNYTGIIFKSIPEYQIVELNDDFRAKITLQLQIPDGFPTQGPEIGSTTEEMEALGQKIYPIFGIDLKRQPNKLISRKFKNGLYYQLGQNKNILWYYSGSFYLGGWDTDLPTEGQKQGLGFEYIPGKYIYLGGFKDGLKHGKGSIKLFSNDSEHPDDFVGYEGEWQNGKPHGFGKHIDENDTKYIGDFVAGEKSGNAKILTKQGLYYEGAVVKGIKHGYGIQKLINGDVYMGQYDNGSFNGKGIYKWINGSSYEGDFVKGLRQGRGVWKGSNGDAFEGEYEDDLKNGWGKFTWTNGQVYEGQFKNDIRHGQGTYRHPSGKVGKFMWKQGKIDYRLYSNQQQKYRSRNVSNEEDIHMTFSPSEQIM